jgi:phosphoenolpyruvate---glycerone phosphotransferase subunit DhaK
MKKLLNEPASFVDESIRGILAAHPRDLRTVEGDGRAIVRADAPLVGKVGIVTGGGSGHLPVFLGYVGPGLCSAAAVGNVFSSPPTETVLNASRAVDGDAGLLYVYGNYGGDVLVFDDAAEELAADGVDVRTVLVADDVASAPPEQRGRRRGVAGLFFAFKVAGAAAEAGLPLARVESSARRAVDATYSMGIGLSPTILPTTGSPSFEIGEDEVELGIGIHGERGLRREPLRPAADVARELAERVMVEVANPGRAAVMVNSLGATPLEELYIVYGTVADELAERGFHVVRTYVGRYATSLEMAGVSLTLLSLDDELEQLLLAPARSPFFVEPPVR